MIEPIEKGAKAGEGPDEARGPAKPCNKTKVSPQILMFLRVWCGWVLYCCRSRMAGIGGPHLLQQNFPHCRKEFLYHQERTLGSNQGGGAFLNLSLRQHVLAPDGPYLIDLILQEG